MSRGLGDVYKRQVEFYAVNKDFPEEDTDKNRHYSRKLKADLFIDDRNLGGLPDWGVIYEMVHNRWSYNRYLNEIHDFERSQKVSWWKRLINKKNTRSKYDRK